jgi:hypothetical protein
MVMLSVGWIAASGLIFGVPILIWSAFEEAYRALNRHRHPCIDLLKLSPRIAHILTRHNFTSIESVHRSTDNDLLALSNMDRQGLQEVRQAISVWKYRRWQDRGFPAGGID